MLLLLFRSEKPRSATDVSTERFCCSSGSSSGNLVFCTGTVQSGENSLGELHSGAAGDEQQLGTGLLYWLFDWEN